MSKGWYPGVECEMCGQIMVDEEMAASEEEDRMARIVLLERALRLACESISLYDKRRGTPDQVYQVLTGLVEKLGRKNTACTNEETRRGI